MKHSGRIRALSFLILFVGVVLVGRLYYIQIMNGTLYQDRAEHQYVRSSQELFDRGTIYFQNKDQSLYGAATVKSGFTVAINTNKVVEATSTYQKINQIAPIDQASFMAEVAKPDPYVELLKRLDPEPAKKIEALKLPGVSLSKDKWRFYPGGELASQVLGFVGYKGNVLDGRYGLERYYADTLNRKTDGAYVNFFAEVFSNLNQTINQNAELEGDIVTTIEPAVQLQLERVLADTVSLWQPESLGAMVMDPTTGEIYAMGSLPSFNPNSFQTAKNAGVYSNPLVEAVYEMGSIIKPITMAAGIDSGAVTAKTTYDDKGFIVIEKAKISNSDKTPHGIIDMQVVLNKSLNTGAAFVEHKMGKDLFVKYLHSFGLGEETGIDLPNEARGFLDTLNSNREVEAATASFGQGIALTPIATVRALSALANGGFLPNPHLVKKINYKVGFSKDITFSDPSPVLKKSTSDEVTRMLISLVDTALRNGTVKMPRYSIAAKTGTAQISQGGGKGYYDDRFLHSFFGYFPAYKPRFIVFFYMIHPKTTKFASDTLTPPFFDMAKFLIHYYDVPPDR